MEMSDDAAKSLAWTIFGYSIGGSDNHNEIAKALQEIDKLLPDNTIEIIVRSKDKN